MEKSKICSVCMNKIAAFSCILCGKSICERCNDRGICLNCRIGKRIKTKQNEKY